MTKQLLIGALASAVVVATTDFFLSDKPQTAKALLAGAVAFALSTAVAKAAGGVA